MKPSAYLPAILKLWRDGLIAPGKVTHVDIGHDVGCAFFTVGVCDCKPLVTVRRDAA